MWYYKKIPKLGKSRKSKVGGTPRKSSRDLDNLIKESKPEDKSPRKLKDNTDKIITRTQAKKMSGIITLDARIKESLKGEAQIPSISLESIIDRNKNAYEKLSEDDVEMMIMGGKTLMEIMKEGLTQLEERRRNSNDPNMDKQEKYTHVKMFGFNVRLIGDANPTDMTKKRFFSILHRRLFKSGRTVVCSLIKNVGIPKVIETNHQVTLIGTGIEYNTDEFTDPKVLWYGAILLDYLSHRRKMMKDGMRPTGVLDYIDNPINNSTLKGLVRQQAPVLSEEQGMQVRMWLEDTKFDISNQIDKRVKDAIINILKRRKI